MIPSPLFGHLLTGNQINEQNLGPKRSFRIQKLKQNLGLKSKIKMSIQNTTKLQQKFTTTFFGSEMTPSPCLDFFQKKHIYFGDDNCPKDDDHIDAFLGDRAKCCTFGSCRLDTKLGVARLP